ncbi:unnamed protein product, partial [Iphiclides podalirius]
MAEHTSHWVTRPSIPFLMTTSYSSFNNPQIPSLPRATSLLRERGGAATAGRSPASPAALARTPANACTGPILEDNYAATNLLDSLSKHTRAHVGHNEATEGRPPFIITDGTTPNPVDVGDTGVSTVKQAES